MDDLGSMEGFSQCLQSMGHGREKQTWGSNIFFFFFCLFGCAGSSLLGLGFL